MSTDFWNKPAASGGDASVIRHAPDRASYHYPDSRELERMPGSRVGAFAVVPAARNDGRSYGFDAESPGLVHVDPDAPDGGAVVDLTQVTKRGMAAAIAVSEYPHEVFYRLGAPAKLQNLQSPAPPPAARVNPVMPGTYVVPAANDQASPFPVSTHRESVVQPVPQLNMPMPQIPSASPPGTVAAPQSVPQQLPPPPTYAYPPAYPQYPAPDLGPLFQMMHEMRHSVTALTSQVQDLQRAPAPPSPDGPALRTLPVTVPTSGAAADWTPRAIPKRAVDIDADDDDIDIAKTDARPLSMIQRENRQRVRDYETKRGEPGDAVITGFETLRIPFITGPLPLKANRQVFFEFPDMGRTSARYHDIIENEHCIALVYDTRYEDGTQYLPPDMGEKQLTLHVPHLKKTYVVSSMGFVFNNGVLDYLVLVKHSVDTLDFAADK